jgi:hypothetical protein
MILLAWLLIALAVAAGLSHFVGAAWGSRAFRPYVGLFAIAVLIAIAGAIVGVVAPEQPANFNLAAKWLAVATGVALCLHGVVLIVAAMFKRR